MSEISSSSKYYIRVRGRILGPYDVSQLQTLRKRGQFSRANEVSTDRQTWQSAATIETLLNGNSRKSSPSADEPVDAAPQSPGPSKPARVMSAAWYYSVGDERLGPVTLLELRGMVSAKQLMPSDLVWKEGLPEWRAIFDVPEIHGGSGSQSVVPAPVAPSLQPADEWNERHVIVDVPGMFANLHRAGLTAGLPIRIWLADRPLSLVWVQIVAFMFCFPLALVVFYGNREIPVFEAAGLISLYFSLIGGAILHRFIRPESISMGGVFSVWLFSAIVGVIIVLVISVGGSYLPFLQTVFSGKTSEVMAYRWMYWVLAVGVVEEASKLIPIFWSVFYFKQAMQPNSATFLGCVSGLAFGCTEAVGYSLQYVSIMEAEQQQFGNYMVIQVLRWISLPLLHAIWTGIASYLISLTRFFAGSRGTISIAALLLVSLLHGSYDFFSSENIVGAPFAVAAVSLLIFVGYIRNQLPANFFNPNPSAIGEPRVNA